MKKQLGKKLALSKETLRNLSDHQLEGVAGGVTQGCASTSSSGNCTGTIVSDCHCPTDHCTQFCTNNC